MEVKMLKRIFILISLELSLYFQSVQAAENLTKQELDDAAYSIGYLFGQNILSSDLALNRKDLLEGLNQALDSKNSKFKNNEMLALTQKYNNEINRIGLEKNNTLAMKNKIIAKDFLEKNKLDTAVKTTKSGLKYIALTKGEGPTPKPTDKVTVHYRGSLINGKEFDSSYSRNEPATFPLNRVIKGWTEGLQLMNVGSTYKFFIPPELGYGEVPPPGSGIEPNSLLIFDVELLAINKPN